MFMVRSRMNQSKLYKYWYAKTNFFESVTPAYLTEYELLIVLEMIFIGSKIEFAINCIFHDTSTRELLGLPTTNAQYRHCCYR